MVDLLTTFDGRISRKSFWVAMLAGLAVALAFVLLVVLPISFASDRFARLLSSAFALLLIYPLAAIVVKRLHDRNKSGMPWALIFLAPAVASSLMHGTGIGHAERILAGRTVLVPTAGGYLVGFLGLVAAIWMAVELGLMSGTVGPNRYGPDPLAPPV